MRLRSGSVIVKPLLIRAPAPARWQSLEDLVGHKGQPWREDIEKRFAQGVSESEDAFAIMPDAGRFLANACINKRGDVGVLGHVFTRPEHRRRGFARRLIEIVLSWFDMTGGKWLYLGTTADIADGLFAKFGFRIAHRVQREPQDGVMMVRAADGVAGDPLADVSGDVAVRDVSRADWPLIVSLLQHRPGPDPRIDVEESAVVAEITGLELISRQDQGTCKLLAATRGERVVGLATVASDQLGERTYAMLMPHSDPLPELRAAVTEFARSKGYSQVDFPMETLTEAAPAAEPTAPADETAAS